mgnify:CR=1 FL=1
MKRIERGAQRSPGSRLAQPQDDSLEVRRQRRSGTQGLGNGGLGAGGLSIEPLGIVGPRDRCHDADRPAPFVEDVENVRLAEVDLHRTAPRPLR